MKDMANRPVMVDGTAAVRASSTTTNNATGGASRCV